MSSQPPWLKLLRDLALTVVALVVLYYLRNIVVYFLIAAVVTLVGRPLCRLLMRPVYKGIRLPAGVAALVTLLSFFGLIFGLLWALAPMVVGQLEAIMDIDPDRVVKVFDEPLNQLEERLAKMGVEGNLEERAENTMNDALNWLLNSGLFASMSHLLGNLGGILMGVFTVGFMAFFFLKEPGLVSRIFMTLLPKMYDEKMARALEEVKHLLRRYFVGLLIQIAIFSTVVSILLSLLGFEHAILIGIFGGILNLIPYLGPIIGGCLGVFFFVSGNLYLPLSDLADGILLMAVAFFGAQLADGLITQPLIFSKSVKAHPLEIFVVILVAGSMAGISGMLIAIPTYTALRTLAQVFFPQNRFVKALSRN